MGNKTAGSSKKHAEVQRSPTPPPSAPSPEPAPTPATSALAIPRLQMDGTTGNAAVLISPRRKAAIAASSSSPASGSTMRSPRSRIQPALPPSPLGSPRSAVATSIEDFDLVRVVGRGSLGKVLLVRHAASGRFFAMKVLNKQAIIERNEVAHTVTEMKVLRKLRHPFVVSLHYAFQSAQRLFLVMDYVNGGELFFHLQKEGRFSEGMRSAMEWSLVRSSRLSSHP